MRIIEINNTGKGEDEQQEVDTRKASAVAIYTIKGKPCKALVDTGAGGCIISKIILDHLG